MNWIRKHAAMLGAPVPRAATRRRTWTCRGDSRSSRQRAPDWWGGTGITPRRLRCSPSESAVRARRAFGRIANRRPVRRTARWRGVRNHPEIVGGRGPSTARYATAARVMAKGGAEGGIAMPRRRARCGREGDRRTPGHQRPGMRCGQMRVDVSVPTNAQHPGRRRAQRGRIQRPSSAVERDDAPGSTDSRAARNSLGGGTYARQADCAMMFWRKADGPQHGDHRGTAVRDNGSGRQSKQCRESCRCSRRPERETARDAPATSRPKASAR